MTSTWYAAIKQDEPLHEHTGKPVNRNRLRNYITWSIRLYAYYTYTHACNKKSFSRTSLSGARSHHCLPTSSISSGRRACATVCWIFRWESRPVMASRPGEKSHAGEHWSSVTSGGDHDGSHGGPQPPTLGFAIMSEGKRYLLPL